MRILFLSDNFPPEVNAPASRTFEHCREWAKAGHEVTVITCAPNFPAGKPFAGYKNRVWRAEEIEGVRVVRVWSYMTANEGFLRRTLDYMSYMVSATITAICMKRSDIVVSTSPQFFTACAGYFVGLVKRTPFVFELRDLWPETIRAVDAVKNTAILDRLERLELFLYRRATLIVSVTNAFRDNLIERGINGDKIAVVTNGCDLSYFSPRPKDQSLIAEFGLAGKFVAGYVGTHGLTHALESLLDAAAILQERGEDDIRLIMLGEGAMKSRLLARARELALNNVQFIGAVSKADVRRYWSILDVSVIHLKRTPLFKTVIPSKMFESMAMGVPVLHCVEGESAEIVEREEAGLLVEPENPDAIADTLVRLKSDPALRMRLADNAAQAAKKFDRMTLAHAMLEHLRLTVEHWDLRGEKR